jgi:2-polyprenyl-6-methoxyphenol hydroxylase-like FAD-dependent oxidoreductase
VQFLGHYYALADLGVSGNAVMYNEPGRMAAVGGPKASAFFVFASEPLTCDRDDVAQQKELVRAAYEGAGWRVPELMAAVPDAGEFYLDSLSRVTIDRYSSGRIVLLGDSAYGNTLGGFGTGLALVGAYVLAGELLAANGDHRVAFARYEEVFRGYAKVSQQGSAGPFLAPPSRMRMRMRNWTFKSRFLLGIMMRMTDKFATDIELQDYPALVRTPA